jgi:cytochrome o ubiquinol oxidase subunit III
MSGRVSEPELLHTGLNLGNHPPMALAQVESDVFGFWVFVISDALLFSLLFAVYGTMIHATAGVPSPAHEFKIKSAFEETLCLLSSSFSYGMVSLSLKMGLRRRWVALWLAITFCLGAYFLRLEVHDFISAIHDGATPEHSGFYSAYFALVGTHGLHVTSGLIWILLMGAQMAVHGLDERVKINFIRLGLFWHFLDVIWVGIFTVVYLQGIFG